MYYVQSATTAAVYPIIVIVKEFYKLHLNNLLVAGQVHSECSINFGYNQGVSRPAVFVILEGKIISTAYIV